MSEGRSVRPSLAINAPAGAAATKLIEPGPALVGLSNGEPLGDPATELTAWTTQSATATEETSSDPDKSSAPSTAPRPVLRMVPNLIPGSSYFAAWTAF